MKQCHDCRCSRSTRVAFSVLGQDAKLSWHPPVDLIGLAHELGSGCERVVRIAGIHKIGTGGAQHSFDLLDRSSNYAARLAGLNLALQLKEPPIGAIETLRQHRCNIKKRDRIYPEYGGRIGDVKL